MNIFKKSLILGTFAFALLGLFPGGSLASGYNPNLTVTPQGGDNVRISISNAAPYGQITLYQRQGTTLWTTITNFGQTDGSGYFSQLITLGSVNSNTIVEMYVTVAGDVSNTTQT